MNVYRLMAIGATSCAAGLCVTACSAGITNAAPPPSPPSATTRATSSPAASPSGAASGSADSGATVSVDAPIGSFPIPHGAQVAANMPCGKQVLIELGSVTPAHASAFYASALPQAGYTITENALTSDPDTGGPQGMAEITFTGHRYTGLIIAMDKLGTGDSSGVSTADLPSNLRKNVVEISLSPSGAGNSSACSS